VLSSVRTAKVIPRFGNVVIAIPVGDTSIWLAKSSQQEFAIMCVDDAVAVGERGAVNAVGLDDPLQAESMDRADP
jgi:hypothetical protein